ncbi:MAG: RnfABCDGE type electron transport complex subunit D [Treponema sp.]|jgi:electron transport complex protein RnfD|nr:RnfABCDGE type electron transport complex subunit D [Treponema sp.]
MADNNKSTPSILLQSSPHMASPVNSKMMMGMMLIALAPVSVFGIIIFGLPALLNIVVSVAAAIAGESLFRLITKQPIRAKDLSAGVTGLLLALVIPPTTPLWMTALGAVFAVVVAKEFFGGLGANIFNPALIGRAFLLISFPVALTTWRQPVLPLFESFTTDVVTGATPIAEFAMDAVTGASSAMFANTDQYWQTMKNLFFGFHAGSMGETSIFLILASCLFLLVTKTIDWRTPVSMITAGAAAAFALGLDPLFAVLSGGLVFGAVFMATDYVTGPVTGKGKVIFGTGAGIIAMLIRKWGVYPEGVMFSILIMNATVPFLNKLLAKKYGFVAKKKNSNKEAAK